MNNEELVELYQSGDNRALDKLIEQNKGIVIKLAKKFYMNDNAIEVEDLEQEGIMGLIIAAKKYDFNNPKKASFITYAINWIYQKIYNTVLGHSTKDKGNKELNNNCTSLNVPILEGEGELQDYIECEYNDIINIDEVMLLKELRNNLDDAMNKYNTLMEREVLKLNYGWDISSMGFNEIAELYNVDVKLISKTKNRALNKLRACKYIKANKINFVNDGLIDCSRFYI